MKDKIRRRDADRLCNEKLVNENILKIKNEIKDFKNIKLKKNPVKVHYHLVSLSHIIFRKIKQSWQIVQLPFNWIQHQWLQILRQKRRKFGNGKHPMSLNVLLIAIFAQKNTIIRKGLESYFLHVAILLAPNVLRV